MERVAFIVEETGERISCMLNPEHIVQRRIAGLAPRRTGAGSRRGHRAVRFAAAAHGRWPHRARASAALRRRSASAADRPAASARPDGEAQAASSRAARARRRRPGDLELATSGWASPELGEPVPREPGTEPTGLPATSPPPRRDVRDHTRPLWQLAENSAEGGRGVPQVRIVLGKELNVLAVVESLAERFEQFDASGTPRTILAQHAPRPGARPQSARHPRLRYPSRSLVPEAAAAAAADTGGDPLVVGGGLSADGGPAAGGETLPEIAARYFGGRSALWRWIADVNLLDDVIWPEPGRDLIIPPAPEELPTGEPR